MAVWLAFSHELLLCRGRGPGDLDRYGTWWGGTDLDLEEQITEVLSLHCMSSLQYTACCAGQHNDASSLASKEDLDRACAHLSSVMQGWTGLVVSAKG